MAGWRRAVELAMTGEEIETMTLFWGRGPRRRAAWSGANAARLSPAAVVFCRGTKTWRASSDGPALRRRYAGSYAPGLTCSVRAGCRSTCRPLPYHLYMTTIVMSGWFHAQDQLKDAKANLSAVVDRATQGKPSVITRHGKPEAVVLASPIGSGYPGYLPSVGF